MWRSWFLCSLLFTQALVSQEKDPYSKERLESFYDIFTCEGNNAVDQVDPIDSGCGQSPLPPVPPVPPDRMPIPPAPMSGMLPVVISNTTGLPANQVYVTLAGQQTTASLEQFFFQLSSDTGVFTPVSASSTTFSPHYSYPLSSFPPSTTGINDYVAFVPSLNGARFYFSIGSPMYLQSDTLSGNPPNQIVAPTYYAFYDPNYSTLFETVEITFFPTGGGTPPAIPWTASVNTTEVDAFCLPIRIGYFSYNPVTPTATTPLIQDPNALPSGFGVGGASGANTRNQILNSLISGLQSGDKTGASPPVWPRLAIPFYSNPYAGTGLQTYLRVLSPKQSLGNAANPPQTGNLTSQHLPAVNGANPTTFKNYNFPPFPADYFSSTSYGNSNSFASSLFNFYSSNSLFISTGGGNPTVYQGKASGSNLTFTGVTGPNEGQTNTLAQANLNTFQMFSGSQAISNSADGTVLGFFFGDAFTIGLLPSSVGTQNTGTPPNIPINITDAVLWQPTFISQYYTPANANITPGGPWYDLYAKLLHNVAVRNTSVTFLNNYGLCYGYDFDDSLGISGTITPNITTPATLNPYLGITLGTIDTPIPNPYSDPNSYSVKFNFPANRTLQYKQGSGPFQPYQVNTPLPNVFSNSTTPLTILYDNGQGNPHQFTLYLLYQIMIPVGAYTSNEISIINSSTITPDDSSLQSFTVNLLP